MITNKKPSRFLPPPEETNRDEPGSIDVKSIFREVAPSKLDDDFFADLHLSGAQGKTFNGMKIGTTSCHASHAVEIKDENGSLDNGLFLVKNEQYQYEDHFIPGASVAGRFARVGSLTDTILITERYADAHFFHQSTGYGVAVALFPENLAAVCKKLAKKFPDKKFIVCAIADETPHSQRRISAAVDAAFASGALVAVSENIRHYFGKDNEHVLSTLWHTVSNAAIPNGDTINTAIHNALAHADPIPWSRPVNGSALLENVLTVIGKHVVLPPHAILTIALWTFFTYVVDAFNIAPILALCSPEKRCGKTTVEQILGELACRPMLLSNVTAAGLYQAIDGPCSTMVIDEADTFLRSSTELIGMINAGYQRKGANVIRGGRSSKPIKYNLFGPKVIAMIGEPPQTIGDRSLMVWLRRKKPSETVSRLRDANEDDFIFLRSQISRWAADNLSNIRDARPALPNLSSDRAIDNWEPLLAIASCIGEECLERAMAAATTLYESHSDDAKSVGEEILYDIRFVFFWSERIERISTKALIIALCSDSEKPWATFNNNRPITPRQLSNLLVKYGIKSKNIRIDEGVAKGYELDQFADAFERYLPVDDAPK